MSRGARDDSVPTPLDEVYPEQGRGAWDERDQSNLRTRGGEPTIIRLANGRLQLRLAPPGRMTETAGQLFLAAVQETNNIRLAAAGIGFAHSSLLTRARRCPDFACTLRLQRRIGQDRALWSLIDPARLDPESWEIADLPMPKMTVEQAMLQLIYHRPDGPFQRSWWHRQPLPVGIEKVAPRIRAKISAMKRADWHRQTGRWRYDGEGEEDGS